MKKYLILFLAFVLILSGCNQVTQSTNTKTIEPKSEPTANTKEISVEKETFDAVAEGEVASSEMIAPVLNTKLIKSNKPEMKLENIIIKIKDALDIGNEYDEVSTEEYSYEGMDKTYNVNLYNTSNSDSAWFSTDVYGNLTSFGRYNSTNTQIEINYTKPEAEGKARELLTKLYGDVADDFIIDERYGYNSFENPNYSMRLVRVVNGIEVPSDTIAIDISKRTNEIMSFQIMTQTNNDFSDISYFASSDDVKDADEAFKKYQEENMMLKGYLGVNSQQTGIYRKLKYIPIFGIFQSQIPIDAVTLEPNYSLTDIKINYGMGATEEAMAKDGLSPAESAHLDDVKEQHTAEEAEKAARDLFALGNDYKMSYSNFGNYMATQGVYTWSMSFNGPNDEYVSVTLLANDLTLVNYSSYDSNSYVNPTEQVQNKNADSYVSIANNFLTEKGKVRLEDLEISYRSNNSQSDFNHQVSYVRKYKEDIFVYSDTITVTINKKEDKVTNYYREWDFELVEDALTDSFGITKDEAFEILKENYGFNLVYRRDAVESNGTPVKLFYEFDSSGVYPNFFQRFLVNGENGDVIDYEGEKVILQDKIVYSDLDQAQRPNIIEEMAENNIGFYEPELKPKQAITQIELFKLFLGSNGYSFGGRDLTDEQVYEMLQYNNLLEDEPKEPNKIITQKDIARYIARYKSYGNIGKLNEIFKDKYEDSTSSDKDFGYLAIAKEKGFIETDGENKLNPDKEITRETALYYLYAIKKDK